MKKIALLLSLPVCFLFAACTTSPDAGRAPGGGSGRTAIQDRGVARQLLGTKPISLQWISWDDFGAVEIKDVGGLYTIKGRQESKENADYLAIDGVITEVKSDRFVFDGTIEVRVYHLNNGQPYTRTGRREFVRYGNRRFWRMSDMENPDGAVDYVDVYSDMTAAKAPPTF